MKLKCVYFSPTGTTRRIIKAITDGLQVESVENYDLTLPEDRDLALTCNSDDLLMVGVPVYAGRVPSLLLPVFEKISGIDTKAIFVGVYGNRDYDDALLELKDLFQENGFVGIAAGAFIGEHSYTDQLAGGRPDEDDLLVASAFGRDIKHKLDNKELTSLYVKGNKPYKEKVPGVAMGPKTHDKCTQCGLCAAKCPTAAINLHDAKIVDETACIKCNSCVKICPVQAKYFDHPMYHQIQERLINNFSQERKIPEIFI